ncbi:transposase family protein [Streptomyces tauricus]|uniref:transposase family protein n=1 Tax=Streptomyces tauricus TaxID=68274 RepID=UPI00339F7E4D
MLVHPSGVDVSSSALRFPAARLTEHRRALGTRWRRLNTGRQALLTLAHLRNGQPYAELAAGLQVIADPKGRLMWASPALAGAVHDVRAAREHGIIEVLAAADISCWADKGYRGAGGTVRLPHRGRCGQWDSLSTGQQAVNRSHAKIRALVEQAIATLKSWRLLRKLRCSTTRITRLAQAVLVLQLTATG